MDTKNEEPPAVAGKVQAVGEALAHTLRPVLSAIPGRPSRPNQLSRALGLNRATSSKLLIALAKQDALEVLHAIPGPEPLRSFLTAAAPDVAKQLIAAAEAAVGEFEALIRNDFGTRSALDAIICSNLPDAREKFELASKYSIFKGMSQLKGVRADTWLGTVVVTPSKTDPVRHDLTWLTGAFSIQHLRSDVTIGFSYRSMRGGGGPSSMDDTEATGISSLPMDEFCSNPPARVSAQTGGEVVHYTLPGDSVGTRFPTDMLVVDDHTAAMKRYATPGERSHSSLFVEPAFPVSLLIFDMLLHEDAFPGCSPELVVYDTGTKGIANVNDETRDIDRMEMQETIEPLGRDLRFFHCEEIPRYGAMLEHLSGQFGWDPAAYRGFRCRIQYPVYGWQTSMSFMPPQAPA